MSNKLRLHAGYIKAKICVVDTFRCINNEGEEASIPGEEFAEMMEDELYLQYDKDKEAFFIVNNEGWQYMNGLAIVDSLEKLGRTEEEQIEIIDFITGEMLDTMPIPDLSGISEEGKLVKEDVDRLLDRARRRVERMGETGAPQAVIDSQKRSIKQLELKRSEFNRKN